MIGIIGTSQRSVFNEDYALLEKMELLLLCKKVVFELKKVGIV